MNLRAIIFGLAIFILTMFVTVYGVDTIYPKPLYEDFCPNTMWATPTDINESVCFELGGKWNLGEKEGYCDKDFTCRENYTIAQETYSMNIFLISVPLGILILICGFYFFRLETVGVGLMLGGVGTMIRGIGSYWQYSPNWIRFLISLGGLIIVIYFSYKFSEKIEVKKSKKH